MEAMALDKAAEFIKSHPASCSVCGESGFLALGISVGETDISARCMRHVDEIDSVELYHLNKLGLVELGRMLANPALKWGPRLSSSAALCSFITDFVAL